MLNERKLVVQERENGTYNKVIFIAMLGVLLLELLLCVKNYTGLYGDGSYIFQLIISSKNYSFEDEYHSLFGSSLMQFFVVALSKLGITDISVLAAAYTFGSVLWRSLFFGASLWLCYKNKNNNYLSLTIVLIALNIITTGMFTMMRYILTTAIFWFLFLFWEFYNEKDDSFKLKAIALVSSVLYTALSSINAFLAPLLLIFVIYKYKKNKFKFNWYTIISLACYLISTITAVYEILQPRDIANRANYVTGIFSLSKALLLILFLLFVGYLLSCFIANRNFLFSKKSKQQSNFMQTISISVQILAALICFVWIILFPTWIAKASYSARNMNLIIPFAFAVFIIFLNVLNIEIPQGVFKQAAIIMIIATAAYTYLYTTGYGNYFNTLNLETQSKKGLIISNMTTATNSDYCFGWPVPLESVFSQAINGVTIIDSVIVQDKRWISWEPFDSYDIATYPDLSLYNLSYDETAFSKLVLYQDDFNPSIDKYIPYESTGIYYPEGEFSWIDNNATLKLNAAKINKAGMIINFTILPQIFSGTNVGDSSVEISINGQKMKSEPIIFSDQIKHYSINIAEQDLPEAVEGLYTINIQSDLFFNPKAAGDSDDDRNLSLLLGYIGEPMHELAS